MQHGRHSRIIPFLTAVLVAICAALPGMASGQQLPRASYFLVHDKGHSAGGDANRDRSRLYVMQFTVSNGRATGVRIVKSYRSQYGLRDEPKRREGDRSTPEGVYRVTDLRHYRPDRTTGPWFFLLDYPNRFDRSANRTGSAIGIHGGPNRRTLGCIRLSDPERDRRGTISINDLRKYVERGTPVVSMPYLPPWLKGETGALLSKEVAEFYVHLLTTPLQNQRAVELVRSFRVGSTSYLAARDDAGPERDLVTVSSELNPFGELTYRAYNLLDGDPKTCWAEGAPDNGVGEWIQVRFPEPRQVRRVLMINGYAKGERWEQNNRVKRASIRLSDGTSFDWHLQDSREWQSFVLPVALTTRFIEISIEEVYRGSRRDWNDTSISELAVEATAPGAEASTGIRMVASASSVLQGGSAISGYNAFNAIDGDPRTAWSEGAEGLGEGEWLRVGFTETRTLAAIRLINGYDKVDGGNDRWRQNPRIRTATIRLSEGPEYRWTLRDTREWQTYRLPNPTATRFVQITIDDAYPGSDWEDNSISEIAFDDADPRTVIMSRGDAAAAEPPTVSASSVLDEESGTYAPENVLDGDPGTCWSEAADDAAGQWLRFDFTSERRVHRVRVINGYDKTAGWQDRWDQNGRVKDAVLRFSDGTERTWRLRDTRDWQSIDLGDGVDTRWVQLVIQDSYPGSRWQDISLSEVRIDIQDQESSASESRDEPALATVEGLTATASSMLVDGDPAQYAPAKLLDGNPQTCWSEGVSGDGRGEWVRIEFPAATKVQRIRLVNGYAKDELYRRNARPKKLSVRLSDGTVYDWKLDDTPNWQSFRLPEPTFVFFIELGIDDVWPGTDWSDCSISEVQVEAAN